MEWVTYCKDGFCGKMQDSITQKAVWFGGVGDLLWRFCGKTQDYITQKIVWFGGVGDLLWRFCGKTQDSITQKAVWFGGVGDLLWRFCGRTQDYITQKVVWFGGVGVYREDFVVTRRVHANLNEQIRHGRRIWQRWNAADMDTTLWNQVWLLPVPAHTRIIWKNVHFGGESLPSRSL